MTVKLSPIGNDAPFVDANGDPLSGGKLYTYVAGSGGSTSATTYQDSGGSTPNQNPVVLDSNGYPSYNNSVVEIWLTSGVSYLFILKTSSGVTVWSRDNVSGINDSAVTLDEWVSGPAPTYVSATSFTLVGDQTSTFTVGRRLKTTNTGGTVYSTITASAFTTLTTVTVVNDSSTLDSGLSAVSYGILQATNQSIPPFTTVVALSSVAGTNTITASATNSSTGYKSNQLYVFIPASANTGATTININSLGAKNIFSAGGALTGGELVNGVPCVVSYDGTQFHIVGGNVLRGTFTASLTGCTGAVTGTANYSVNGNVVVIDLPALTGTSNTTEATITGMPVGISPTSSKNSAAVTTDNGAAVLSTITIVGGTQVITLNKGTTPTATFTNSGTKGLSNTTTITYTLT